MMGMRGNSPPQSAAPLSLLAIKSFAIKSSVSITQLTTYAVIKTHLILVLMLMSCSLRMRMTTTVMVTLTGMLASLVYSMHSLFTLVSTQNPVSHNKWISYGFDGSGEIQEHNDTHTYLAGSPRDLNEWDSFQEIPLEPLDFWTRNKSSVVFT